MIHDSPVILTFTNGLPIAYGRLLSMLNAITSFPSLPLQRHPVLGITNYLEWRESQSE